MIKKTILLLLIILIGLNSACSKKPEIPEPTESGKVSLTISVRYEGIGLKNTIEEFKKRYPDINVSTRTYPMPAEEGFTYDKYVKAVNNEVFSEQAADIISIQGLPYYEYIEKGVLLELDAFLEESGYNNENYLMNIIDSCKYKDSLYLMPVRFNTDILAVSKEDEVLSKNDSNRITWDSFMDYCRILYDKNNSKPFIAQTRPIPLHQSLMGDAYKAFVNIPQRTSDFLNEEFLTIMDFTKEINDYYVDNSVTTTDINKELDMCGLKMLPHSIGSVEDILLLKATFGSPVSCLPLPKPKDNSEHYFMLTEVYGINSASKYPNEAWLFINFMLSEEIQQNCSGIPVNRNVFNSKLNEISGDDKTFTLGKSGGDPLNPAPEDLVTVSGLSEEERAEWTQLFSTLNSANVYSYGIDDVITNELQSFYKGERNAEETAQSIQERISIFLRE